MDHETATVALEAIAASVTIVTLLVSVITARQAALTHGLVNGVTAELRQASAAAAQSQGELLGRDYERPRPLPVEAESQENTPSGTATSQTVTRDP